MVEIEESVSPDWMRWSCVAAALEEADDDGEDDVSLADGWLVAPALDVDESLEASDATGEADDDEEESVAGDLASETGVSEGVAAGAAGDFAFVADATGVSVISIGC